MLFQKTILFFVLFKLFTSKQRGADAPHQSLLDDDALAQRDTPMIHRAEYWDQK